MKQICINCGKEFDNNGRTGKGLINLICGKRCWDAQNKKLEELQTLKDLDSAKVKIIEQHLLAMGYDRNEWIDKDDPKSELNDLFFVEYTKPIDEHFSIQISFSYKMEQAPDGWKHISTSVELSGGGETLTLANSIEAAEDVYKTLKKYINAKPE